MSFDIVLWLVQDGIVNGAIYALLALALLLVFAVTRAIFVPQGEFISYAALSLALLQAGKLPGTVYVLVGGGAIAALLDIAVALRDRAPGRLPRILAVYVLLPLAMAGIAWWAAPRKLDMWIQVLIVLGLVVPLGPILYRVAYRPLAGASVLVLFIISMAAHYVLTGLGLVFFGGEGLRSQAFSDAHFKIGVLNISAQSVLVVLATVLIMASLWLFFEHSIYGKALRATAINRVGARLVGIPAELSGSLGLAASINAGDAHCMAQAQHGSAPDIAGQDRANPASLVLSAGMLLGWLGRRHRHESFAVAERAIEAAVDALLRDPATRTHDLGGTLGTRAWTRALREKLDYT